MIYSILLSLLLSSNVFAFNSDFKTTNDRVPLEFNYLFESLKLSIKAPKEQLRLVGICKDLDENLGYLKTEHLFLLMKSEVIKNVLEYRHQKVRSFDVTTFLITRLEEDFAKKQALLTPFSQWLWRSILAELKYREKLGLITEKSFNPNTFQGQKLVDARRFQRYLGYLLPWIDKMDSLDAPGFNELLKKVSWVILERLNQRSLLFKRFASTSASETKVTIFNIPAKLLELHPEDIKRMQQDASPLTLKEESEKEKTEASTQIQQVSPDDLSPLSDELSKELDKKTP